VHCDRPGMSTPGVCRNSARSDGAGVGRAGTGFPKEQPPAECIECSRRRSTCVAISDRSRVRDLRILYALLNAAHAQRGPLTAQ